MLKHLIINAIFVEKNIISGELSSIIKKNAKRRGISETALDGSPEFWSDSVKVWTMPAVRKCVTTPIVDSHMIRNDKINLIT